jgi:hypothetical protein
MGVSGSAIKQRTAQPPPVVTAESDLPNGTTGNTQRLGHHSLRLLRLVLYNLSQLLNSVTQGQQPCISPDHV